jgi:ribonuclease P protein component
MTNFTFKKEERLCSQKIIGEIFLAGNSFLCYPLKVVWLKNPVISGAYPAQVSFSVPKKNFKSAHDRNLIRRRMRESYRCLKSKLYELMKLKGQKIALMIIYIGKEESSFNQIESAMTKIIHRLEQEDKFGKPASRKN